jgi:hypothetical protein
MKFIRGNYLKKFDAHKSKGVKAIIKELTQRKRQSFNMKKNPICIYNQGWKIHPHKNTRHVKANVNT